MTRQRASVSVASRVTASGGPVTSVSSARDQRLGLRRRGIEAERAVLGDGDLQRAAGQLRQCLRERFGGWAPPVRDVLAAVSDADAGFSGSEDCNRFGAVLSRLVPGAMASRCYTRWLGQVSDYLPG